MLEIFKYFTIAMIALFPHEQDSIWLSNGINEKMGIGTEAIEGKRSFSIFLESVLQLENDGVGYDWNHFLSVQEEVIKKGDTLNITIEKRAPIVIEANSIEEDKHHSDVGKNTLTLTYSDLIAIERQRFQIDVTVIENGGQRAGNIAKWKFMFMITQE